MLQARSGHGHATFGSCSAVPRAGPRLRSTAVRVSSEQEAAAAVRAPSGRTIEECEADAVAGKFPAPPPLVRPKAPEGTPEIRPLVCTRWVSSVNFACSYCNRKILTCAYTYSSPHVLFRTWQSAPVATANHLLLGLHSRRRASRLLTLCSHCLSMKVGSGIHWHRELNTIHIWYAGFARCWSVGEEDAPIGAMPGCYRLGWRHGLLDEVLNVGALRVISYHECLFAMFFSMNLLETNSRVYCLDQ